MTAEMPETGNGRVETPKRGNNWRPRVGNLFAAICCKVIQADKAKAREFCEVLGA